MCECNLILSVVGLTCFVAVVTSFNIESFHYAVYGPPDRQSSMFGFTVGLHRERNTGWILVGAPESQSRYQPVRRGGVVYKCSIDRDESCEEIPFDRRGNNIRDGSDIDNKTEQWFGATLSTSGRNNGPIVACAPRYIWYASAKKRRDPVGTCYVSNGAFSSFEEYSPCRTSQWGYHRQGSCQAGFSAAINGEGDRVFIGAPGSWYWQGQMYSVDAHAKFPFSPGLFSRFGGKGQVIQQSTETRPAVYSTKEGTAKDDDSYLGYSTVIGDFAGTGVQGVAVGMPRGANLHGKVLLYTWDLTNFKNFSGDQLGSYFGYSLGSVDVDGDKKDDIVIGAPMYTIPNNEGKYEVGRVYVIYHGGVRGSFTSSYVIEGFKSKSRFGQALCGLGDINQDGYGDFAVGAPYDGPEERGAVYIYHGSEKGVRKTYSQVIYAEDVSHSPPSQSNLAFLSHPSTFGFSVSGGVDLDGNDYPDFAVGSYLSNTAFFFRSRPVVRVEAFVRFMTAGKQIDIKEDNCRLKDGRKVACTTIDFCVKYSGKGIPSAIYLEVQYILDTRQPKRPRMAFIEAENVNSINNTIRLEKDKGDTCERKQIYLRPDLYDKLTALEAEVKYWMREQDRGRDSREIRDPNSRLLPILDLNSPPVKKDFIVIKKNCGPDNVCIPNLSINISSSVQQYLFGSKENLNLTIIVNNNGEDSFGTTFSLVYPDGIYYKKVDDKSQQHATCRNTENRTLNCDIGNPLPAGSIVKFDVILQPFYKEGLKNTFEFDMYVNSTNPEDERDRSDNHQHVSIKVWADSNLELRGVSHPPELYFNETLYPSGKIYNEQDIGPQVIHTYFLRNLGPASLEETELLLSWPYATLEGESFLYLLEQPHTLGNVKCHHVAEANYLNITIEENFSWERINVKETANEFHSVLTGGGVSLETDTITTGITGNTVINTGQQNITSLVGGSEDISVVDQQRHNASLMESGSQRGVVTTTYSEYETQIRNGIPYTIVTNTTTVKDAKGNVLNTYIHQGTSDNHMMGAPHRGSQGSIKNDGARITTTHTRYETTIINGVPVTTVTNITTVSDAITGQIISSNTVSEGSMTNVVRPGSSSGSSYYEKTQSTGNTINLNNLPIDGKPIVNKIESSNFSSVRQGGAQTGSVFQWNGRNNNEQGERRYQTDYRIGPPVNQQTPQTISFEANEQSELTRNSAIYSSNSGHDGSLVSESQGFTGYQSESNEPTAEDDHAQTGYFDGEGVYRSYSRTVTNENNGSSATDDSYGENLDYGSRGNINFNQDLGNFALNRGYTSSISEVGSGNHLDLGGSVGQSGGGAGQSGGKQKIEFTEEVALTGTYDPDTGRFIPDARQGRSYKSRSKEIKKSQQASSSSNSRRSSSSNSESSSSTSFSKDERHWSNSQSVPSTSYNSINGDNVAVDRPINKHGYIGRKKRQAIYHHRGLHFDKAMMEAIKCYSTKCFHVKCVVGRLAPEKEVVVAFRGRISAEVLKNATDHSIKFSSMMAAKITKLPYFGKTDNTNVSTFEIETNVPGPPPDIKSDVVPLWIILLSAIAGTLILLLAILLLYKLGFFKRNRPSSAPERQPLNRNGYHQGDEAL